MNDNPTPCALLRSRWPLLALALLAFVLAALIASAAQAEDAQDVRGTRSGCVDVTIGAAWSGFTSADMEDSAGSGALAASLYWTELTLTGGSAALYVCTGPAAGCGANTTDKRAVAASGSLMIPLRGTATQTVSLRAGGAGVTGQLCGYFRAGG